MTSTASTSSSSPASECSGEDDGKERPSGPPPQPQGLGVGDIFLTHLHPLLERARVDKRPLRADEVPELYPADRVVTNAALYLRHQRAGRSLVHTLYLCYGREFVLLAVPLLLLVLGEIAVPSVVSRLIAFCSDPLATTSEGVALVALLFCAYLANSMTRNYYHMQADRLIIRVRVALQSAVVRKALHVPTLSKGEAQNLLSLDPDKIGWMVYNAHDAWALPLHALGITVALYQSLGVSAFVPLTLALMFAPLNAWIGTSLDASEELITTLCDARIKLLTETLQAIQVVKLFGWETRMRERVAEARGKEIGQVRRFVKSLVGLMFMYTCLASVISVSTFATYVLLGNELTADVLFPSVLLFASLVYPVMRIPAIMFAFTEAKNSAARLGQFFGRDEVVPVDPTPSSSSVVDVQRAKVAFPTSAVVALRHVSMRVEPGQLVMVVGRVGSCKSALVKTLLGEMNVLDGGVAVSAQRTAYCSQVPWIRNATVRDNVCWGAPFERRRYERVIFDCALGPDLLELPAGDLTEIGEAGVNISGGQKARLALARAAYSQADLVVLDDVLSAVDVHVGEQLFERCICSNMAGKTRIVVTHQLQYLPRCDHIVVVKDGRIEVQGKYDALLSAGLDFHDFLPEDTVPDDVPEREVADCDSLVGIQATDECAALHRSTVDDEHRAGTVSLDTYRSYMRLAGGTLFFVALVGTSLAMEGFTSYSRWFLASSTEHSMDSFHFVAAFVALALGECVCLLARQMVWVVGSLRAAETMHDQALDSVLHAPISFFQKHQLGRITGRFSSDVKRIDRNLADELSDVGLQVVKSAVAVLTTVAVMPSMLVPAALVLLAMRYLLTHFRGAARELQHLESVCDSPVHARWSELVDGLPTIRAFNQQRATECGFYDTLELYNRAKHTSLFVSRWLYVRMEVLGAFWVGTVAALLVASKGSGSVTGAGAAGAGIVLVLSQALYESMAWLLQVSVRAETTMMSVERVHEYRDVRTEPADDPLPPTDWPQRGHLEFQHVCMRYAPDLDPALRDVTFEVQPGEKVGIVGRSGAGKSSASRALFRLYELESGRILIDGEDIAGVRLSALRQAIAIIPQDPVLFSGTLRENVDPFHEYSDEQIDAALDKVHMTAAVHTMGGLGAPVADNGRNLSLGQRQLLCLARALLKPSRFLILDEATAAVDTATDHLIQRTIRHAFADRTCLTIAHRLDTVLDADKILVLDAGQVREFGSPADLLARKDGVFRGMVTAAKGASSAAGKGVVGAVEANSSVVSA